MASCDVRTQDHVTIVALSGEVDLDSSSKVRKTLLECVGAAEAVVVDMSGVSYIDSSGVASLVEAYQAAKKRKTPFSLAHVSQAAMRVFELARLDKVFTIHPSIADGLKHAR